MKCSSGDRLAADRARVVRDNGMVGRHLTVVPAATMPGQVHRIRQRRQVMIPAQVRVIASRTSLASAWWS